MNPGKKLIRNTVFGLWGAAVLFVGINRMQPIEAGTAGSSLLTLGLRHDRGPEANPEISLSAARDFTQLSVRGRLNVEVVGAETFRVTLLPEGGQAPQVHATLEEGVLRVNAVETAAALQGVLRVEVPTLQRIDAAAAQVTVQGLSAPEVSVYMYEGGVVQLHQNRVQRWQLFSGDPLDASVDDATFAAGTLRTNGNVVIRRAP